MKSAVFLSFLLLFIASGCNKRHGSDIRTGTLTVQVTESYLPLVQQLVTDYHGMYPDVVITIHGTTTRGAIVDMVNDSAHCIIVDRRLNEEEQGVVRRAELRVVETEIAHDGLAILVHPQNKLSAVSIEALGSILSGEIALWSKLPDSKLVGAIELCLTGRNSGLYEMVAHTFFKLPKDISLAAIAPSQETIIQYVAAHPEALGIVSYAQWKDTTSASNAQWEKRVRMIDMIAKDADGTVAAVKLNQRTIYDRIYPLTYSLYAYTSERTPGTAHGFSAYIDGDLGQRTFLYYGLVPKTMPYRTIQLTQE
jgi:phosphate transport system substrate-binding protein